MVLAIKR